MSVRSYGYRLDPVIKTERTSEFEIQRGLLIHAGPVCPSGLERAAGQHPEESLEQSLHTAPLRSSADQKVVETQRHQT
ncbi:unnamed protein product [Boreogadus saida]